MFPAKKAIFIVLLWISQVGIFAEEQSLWRFSTGGQIRGRPAVTNDGIVYVLSEDRYLYSLDEQSGKMRWRCFIGGRVWDSIAVGPDGTIYTVLKTGALIAINREGKTIWRFGNAGTPVGDPAIAHDGSIYFCLDNGKVIAVSHTGRLKWSLELPASPTASPSVDSWGTVLVPCSDGILYALSPWGNVVWQSVLAGKPTSAAISEDGLIVVGTDYGSIVALDRRGVILWDFVYEEPFLSPVLSKNAIYGGTRSGTIFKIDFEGNIIGTTSVSDQLQDSLILSAGYQLYAVSKDGLFYRIADDGTYSWERTTTSSGRLFMVSPAGKIIVSGKDWQVRAFDSQPIAEEGWPSRGNESLHSSRQRGRRSAIDLSAVYGDDPDFVYLSYLAGSNENEMKKMALSEMEHRIQTGERKSSFPYVLLLLENLASEGLLSNADDFPEIRGQASLLLGHIGGRFSAQLLVRILTYEYDGEAVRKILRGLSLLQSDPEGRAVSAIAGIIFRDIRLNSPPDSRLATEAMLALESISFYHGTVTHPSGTEVLMAIFQGDYPKEVRQKALNTLRNILASGSNRGDG